MFTGLTVATMLGVPVGTWLGLHFGWRATFWAVTLIGVAAFAVHRVPSCRADSAAPEASDLARATSPCSAARRCCSALP